MPKRLHWTEEQDRTIRAMRFQSASWDCIAAAIGVTRWTVIERGRRLGVRLPPPEPEPEEDGAERPALPPGHTETWDIIIRGTCLEGMPYPIPSPTR